MREVIFPLLSLTFARADPFQRNGTAATIRSAVKGSQAGEDGVNGANLCRFDISAQPVCPRPW